MTKFSYLEMTLTIVKNCSSTISLTTARRGRFSSGFRLYKPATLTTRVSSVLITLWKFLGWKQKSGRNKNKRIWFDHENAFTI